MSKKDREPEFDKRRAKAFAGKLATAMNHGALCLMLSVGHRTGLFDAMRGRAPGTSEEIARAAGLNERYVREWLAAMVTARVVEYEAAGGRYFLPAEHAASLTRAAGADNVASFTQYFAEMGRVEDDIVECFRKGGGVPYERYPRFQEVMMEDSGQAVVKMLESHILPLAPGVVEKLERGIRVLDVGCGRGRVMLRLAELYPKSRFSGVDLSAESTGLAREEAARRGLGNVEFVTGDASVFLGSVEAGSQDFITAFDAIHDQARPLEVLRGIERVLKQDGIFLMQDINGTSHLEKDMKHPMATLLYTVSCLHCMTVSLAQGGEGVGAMWGEEKTREYLGKAGFGRIETRRLEHDVMNNWYVVGK